MRYANRLSLVFLTGAVLLAAGSAAACEAHASKQNVLGEAKPAPASDAAYLSGKADDGFAVDQASTHASHANHGGSAAAAAQAPAETEAKAKAEAEHSGHAAH